MHMHISVYNSCSLQHMELKINIEIQEGSLYLTTNSDAMETLVMGVSNNYSVQTRSTKPSRRALTTVRSTLDNWKLLGNTYAESV